MSQAVSEYIKERGECTEKAVELKDTVRRHNPGTETEDTNKKTRHTVQPTAGDRCYRLAVACVLLLSVLLLIATTVLWIKFSILNTEKDRLQTTYNTLLIKRAQLQTSYNKLTVERNQLRTSYMKRSLERDQLQDRNNNLTVERKKQRDTIQNLQNEVDQLTKMKDTLETMEALRWTSFDSSMYYFPVRKTWDESKEDCMERGADLVIINSKAEQFFINTQLGSYGRAWIGLNDRGNEGAWKWVDGTALNTGFWRDREPNNDNDEDCVEIFQPDDTKSWNDNTCSAKSHWICEKKSASV